MSNCVVRSGGLRLPCSIIAKHSVEGCDHFSHDGDDDDLGFFVGGGEAFVEGFEGGTVTACAEGGHVEDVTDRHPTTIDAAVSLELAAVEVIRCEADEGGDLFAAHLPEFWQQGDECEGQHGADAWHRGQQLIALSESNIGGNHLGQALVEAANIGLQSRLATFAEPPKHWHLRDEPPGSRPQHARHTAVAAWSRSRRAFRPKRPGARGPVWENKRKTRCLFAPMKLL